MNASTLRRLVLLSGGVATVLLSTPLSGFDEVLVAVPVLLRSPHDVFNQFEIDGVPGNELERPLPPFKNVSVGSGNTLRVLDGVTLEERVSIVLLGSLTGASPLLSLDDGTVTEVVSREDGVVTRVNPLSGATLWSQSVRRGSCGSDHVRSSPAVHLRRRATTEFKASYSTDLVYVGTHHDDACGAASTTQNRVYALRATDGTTAWAFNETGGFSMDVIGGVVVDAARQTEVLFDGRIRTSWKQSDTLFATTERRASVSQASVWAIDLLTGSHRWSVGHGRILTPPMLSPAFADRIYVNTRAGEIKALRKTDGSQIWALSTGGPPFLEAMAVEDGGPAQRIVAVDFFGRLWVARDNGTTGEWLWQVELPTGPVPLGTSVRPAVEALGTPVIDRNANLYVGASGGTIYQVSLDTGAIETSHTVDFDAEARITEVAFHSADGGATVELLAASSAGRVVKEPVPLPVLPDLTTTAVSNPPFLMAPGQSFTVDETVVNQGFAAATDSRSRYFLSLDAAWSADDVLLTGVRFVPGLAVGATAVGSRVVTVPTATAAGTYQLLACADDTKRVAETHEGNNCHPSGAPVVVALPDLVTSQVSGPASAAPGQRFVVIDTVVNQGEGPAVASRTRHYLSLDSIYDASDILMAGTRAVPGLMPDGTSSGNTSVTIPSAVAPGTYVVIACADDLNRVTVESDEKNNCTASDDPMVVALPDLVTTLVTSSPGSVAPGQRLTLTDIVVNQGAGPAGASITQYYVSLDEVKDSSDILLIGKRIVEALGPGAFSAGSRTVTVPTTTPLGTYFVLACADDSQQFTESDDANNCRASATTVVLR